MAINIYFYPTQRNEASMPCRMISVAVIAVGLVGCASTTYYPGPKHDDAVTTVGGLSLVNDQDDISPRVFFSDGITTLTTNYRNWTQDVIQRVKGRLVERPDGRGQTRIVKFSLESISCTGHYIRDCSASLRVVGNGGQRRTFNSTRHSGLSALENALDELADLATTEIRHAE